MREEANILKSMGNNLVKAVQNLKKEMKRKRIKEHNILSKRLREKNKERLMWISDR
jgi:hypothetical protein